MNAVAFSFGYDSFSATRFINLPAGVVTATSSSRTLYTGLHGRSAYLFDFGDAYVKPYADLDLGYYDMSGFQEHGAGAIGLDVKGTNEFVAVFSPTLKSAPRRIWANNSISGLMSRRA